MDRIVVSDWSKISEDGSGYPPPTPPPPPLLLPLLPLFVLPLPLAFSSSSSLFITSSSTLPSFLPLPLLRSFLCLLSSFQRFQCWRLKWIL
eukprot:16041-Hanusia_phi.AAC.1